MRIIITLDSGEYFRTISTDSYSLNNPLRTVANEEQKRLIFDVTKAVAAASKKEHSA